MIGRFVSAVANDRRALAGPEECLVDQPLREVAGLDFGDHGVDERDFRFEPRLEADDQSIAKRDRPVWLGRRDVDLFDFVGGHGALHNATADRRGQDERRTA